MEGNCFTDVETDVNGGMSGGSSPIPRCGLFPRQCSGSLCLALPSLSEILSGLFKHPEPSQSDQSAPDVGAARPPASPSQHVAESRLLSWSVPPDSALHCAVHWARSSTQKRSFLIVSPSDGSHPLSACRPGTGWAHSQRGLSSPLCLAGLAQAGRTAEPINTC